MTEFFLLGLVAADDGHGQDLLTAVGIDFQHLKGLFPGLFFRGVDGVAFLPEKFSAAKEGAGSLFPAKHGAPLIVFHGKIPIGVNDMAPVITEQGLGSGAHTKALRQFLAAAVGDPGTLRCKTFHVILFLLQKAFGDQDRHGDVFVSQFLKASVQIGHDIFPDGIAIWPHDEQSLNSGVIHQLSFGTHVGEPLGKIHFHISDLFDFLILCHRYYLSKLHY